MQSVLVNEIKVLELMEIMLGACLDRVKYLRRFVLANSRQSDAAAV